MLNRRQVLQSMTGLFLSGCAHHFNLHIDNDRRVGRRPLRIAVWGDIRPSCTTGIWDPVTAGVFKLLDKLDEQKPFDLVVTTGDYVCAWPWQGELALKQLDGAGTKEERKSVRSKVEAQVQAGTMTQEQADVEILRVVGVLGVYPKRLLSRTILALGNHEVAHHQLFRSSNFAAEAQTWYDFRDLRVVVLPSEQDIGAMPFLTREWLVRALDHNGRLIVVRHEPPLSCGTWQTWIMNQVRRVRPNVVLYGHVHTWLGPNSTYTECGRRLRLERNELIVGNGGASGWRQSVGWAGVTVLELQPDGSVRVQGIDTSENVRTNLTINPK